MEPINDRIVVGGTYPADIWREFMILALQDSPVMEFTIPEEKLVDIEICSESDLIPIFWCPEEILIWKIFVKGDEPDDTCDIHNKVEIPDVVSLSIDEAEPIFEELFTEITLVHEFNDTYNQGIIFEQSPPARSFLESLTGEKLSVILYISKGEQTFNMPDLTGLELNNAKNILSAFDMEINDIIYEFSELEPVDRIFGQTPAKDSTVTKSTEVKVFISKGINPEGEIPGLIGLTEEEAILLLSLSGYENISILYEESPEEIEKVFSQAPDSGTAYNKFAEVILIISRGIMVPDIIGLELEDAVIMLEDLGFELIILPDGVLEGTVSAQIPDYGGYLDYSSSITIEVEEVLPPEEEEEEEEA